MFSKEILNAVGEIDDELVRNAKVNQKTNSRKWMKRGAMAACLCLIVAGSLLYASRQSPDFSSMLKKEMVNTEDIFMLVPISDWTACYQQMDIAESKLKQYIGNRYLTEDTADWHFLKGEDNLKYLIRKDADGSLTLWMFTAFEIEENRAYTYGDVLSVIYGVDAEDAIVSITASPLIGGNTADDKVAQNEVGTITYTDREILSKLYNILKDVVCYGTDGENPADNMRFSYSFSVSGGDGSTSAEITYAVRCLSIEFTNGAVLDSWKYNALSGSFFEYGGIFTEPLEEDAVYLLNGIFNIE